MPKTFPKIKRLDKAPVADAYGIGDSPIGYILAGWQGPLLVRLYILPAGAEKRLAEVIGDWGWSAQTRRDDKRAQQLIKAALFPKMNWTGDFPADLVMGFYGTDFQWNVMQKMLKIPSGKTMSYGGLANAANFPKAARAAGSVCARNPLPLIVPCHRVLGSAGAVGHYGFGPALKRQLLDWER